MCMLSSSVGQLSTCIAVLYGLVMFQVHLAGKQKQDVKLVASTLSIDRMGSRNPLFGHRALGLKFGSLGF